MQPVQPHNLTKSTRARAACFRPAGARATAALALWAFGPAADADTASLPVETLTGAPAATPPCIMDRPGLLQGRLFGALEADLAWSGPDLHCDGMPRPGGGGLRLFFSHPLAAGGQLALVLGIDGEVTAAGPREWPVTVTVIAEGQGQFFSSAGQERCWARIDELVDLADEPRGWRIDGMLFCVGSLPSLGDLNSVTLPELRFSGRITDDD